MTDLAISEQAELIELVNNREAMNALSKFCADKASEANAQCCRLMRSNGNDRDAAQYATRGQVWENLIPDLKDFVEKLQK